LPIIRGNPIFLSNERFDWGLAIVNKKQEVWKALILLLVGTVIGVVAFSYRHQVLNIKKPVKRLVNDSTLSYTDCKIYSSVPGQYEVRMKFMIPADDADQKDSIEKNMARIKDNIFTNISSDTEMGTALREMKWNDLKTLLIAAINDNSDKPVKTIYFQEALIMNLR
jgi:hypothetical protein